MAAGNAVTVTMGLLIGLSGEYAGANSFLDHPPSNGISCARGFGLEDEERTLDRYLFAGGSALPHGDRSKTGGRIFAHGEEKGYTCVSKEVLPGDIAQSKCGYTAQYGAEATKALSECGEI